MLEAKNHLIFSKMFILQQKFELFCKIWEVDAGSRLYKSLESGNGTKVADEK